MEAAHHPWPALGVLLLRDGLVSKEDLESVLDEQRDERRQRLSGSRLGDLLVERGLVTREQVAKTIAEQYELPFIELEDADVDLRVARLLSEDLARHFLALPIGELPGGSLLVAIADPATVLFAEDLRNALGAPLRFAVVPQDAMELAIARVHETGDRDTSVAHHGEWPGAGDAFEEHRPDDGDASPAERSDDERYLGSTRTVAHLWPPLGALLVRDGLVTHEELDAALAQQRLSGGKRLGEILFERGTVTLADVARLVAEQYELPFVDLAWADVDPRAAALLPEEIAHRYSALPIGFEPDGSLRVVISDPASVLYSEELRVTLRLPLVFAVAALDAIEDAIERTYVGDGEDGVLDDSPSPDQSEAFEGDEPEDEAEEAETGWFLEPSETPVEATTDDGDAHFEEAVVVELATPNLREVVDADAPEVEEAIERALALGATDVHFTPQPHAVVVRIRIDGILRELATFPISRKSAITARLKLLGGLEAHGAHAIQEGRLALDEGDGANLRIVVLPTAHGEKSTLHLLSELSQPTSLAELGLTQTGEEALRRAIAQPSGLVLVCGSAGNGCSTTLYAALRELNTPERALATIEDPVEQVIPGADQVGVDPVTGLTYESGLHAILLSDPDVVLVGELADAETAVGAVRAAVSGRLVLSRLAVRSPAAAPERLFDLGAERGPVTATLSCVVAQRLVRRICPDCREPYYASADELAELGRSSEEAGRRLLARGSGCVACGGTGFRGRVAIFEVLSVSDEIRSLLASGATTGEIEHAAVAAGMQTFRDEGVRLVLEGITTVSELQRVLTDDMDADATAFPEDPDPTASVDGASARA